MYVITFYSFKGGVGRTFALVNIGVELAKAGRRVLLVDFDLEAPGLHTFDALRPREPHNGMVEYVTDYIATRSAPDVRDYIYQTESLKQDTGGVWIMPAGRGGDEYRRRLASINWQHLYQDRELGGYLFFEDLKAQWRESLKPDYVLIDSRTGHTDIQGICTRQLPDAVVILFFPNEQNLAGLKDVVTDINAEVRGRDASDHQITLHFVMSNVPDLDDEDGILRDRVHEFRKVLGCDRPSMIHNYPSLALLNQTIFTLERSKSRLAREYRRLKDEIVDHNTEDAEGVIRFLSRLSSPHDSTILRGIGDVEQRLREIQDMHGENGEVLFWLGMIRKNRARLRDAVLLFDKSIEADFDIAKGLLERATCYSLLNKEAEAVSDVRKALECPGLHSYELLRLIDLLGKYCPDLLATVPQCPSYAFLDPDARLLLVETLAQYDAGVDTALAVFRANADESKTPRKRLVSSRFDLLLALIRSSCFRDATSLFHEAELSSENLSIQDAFNYAMADWGDRGAVSRDIFARVVELDQREPMEVRDVANYNECLAVALWAVGRPDEALKRLAVAENMARGFDAEQTEFSCWRYRGATRQEFLADCEAIRALISRGEGQPLFFRTNLVSS